MPRKVPTHLSVRKFIVKVRFEEKLSIEPKANTFEHPKIVAGDILTKYEKDCTSTADVPSDLAKP